MPEILAYVLLVLSCFGAGVCGAWVYTWGLGRSLTDAQFRIEDLERRTLGEIRKAAGAKGREKLDELKNLETWALENKGKPETTGAVKPLKPLAEWRKEKMVSG